MEKLIKDPGIAYVYITELEESYNVSKKKIKHELERLVDAVSKTDYTLYQKVSEEDTVGVIVNGQQVYAEELIYILEHAKKVGVNENKLSALAKRVIDMYLNSDESILRPIFMESTPIALDEFAKSYGLSDKQIEDLVLKCYHKLVGINS